MSATPPSLYAEREDWADVKPVQQYDTVSPLAPIFYSADYKDATDYFRAIVKSGEMSPRVLDLTEDIIRMNPAHYSAWQYRYKTLMALKSPLDVELRLMDELAVQYLKTYQVWHHRRLILTETRHARPELDFIARSLQVDSKNYHTWSYRQWLLSYFNQDDLWAGELDYTEQMLKDDVRNNSAWHHRFFVAFQSGLRKGEEDREAVIRRELNFVKQNISLAPNNPSAWNYLRGVLDHNKIPYATLQAFVTPYSIAQPVGDDDVVDLDHPLPSKTAELPCPAAIEFLADVYEREGGDSVHKATQLWKSLADEHDTIRKKYWDFRAREALGSVITES